MSSSATVSPIQVGGHVGPNNWVLRPGRKGLRCRRVANSEVALAFNDVSDVITQSGCHRSQSVAVAFRCPPL